MYCYLLRYQNLKKSTETLIFKLTLIATRKDRRCPILRCCTSTPTIRTWSSRIS